MLTRAETRNLLKHAVAALGVMVVLVVGLSRARGEPDGEQFLEKREVTTSMFIIGLAYDGATLTGLQLAYIPPELQAQCWGKSLDACKAILRQAGTITSAGPLPAKVYEVSVSVLDGSERTKAVLAEAAKTKYIESFLGTAEKGPHEYHLPTIERAVKMRAMVRWEGWTNGDGIHRVLSVPAN